MKTNFFKSLVLKLLYSIMSDVDDEVVKPIKCISNQKILEKLELIEKKIDELIQKKQVKNQWRKIVILTRIREAYMLIN